MIELLACSCSIAAGGKFVVLAVLFAIWMISLIVSRPRGPQGDQMHGLSGDDEVRPRAPRGPAGDDMTEEIGFRHASTTPAREIITRPDMMNVTVRPTGWQFVKILLIVGLVSALVTGGLLFAWYKMKMHANGESEDVRRGGTGDETTQPAESEDIAIPQRTETDDEH